VKCSVFLSFRFSSFGGAAPLVMVTYIVFFYQNCVNPDLRE